MGRQNRSLAGGKFRHTTEAGTAMKVLFFAALRERLNCDEYELTISLPTDTDSVRSALQQIQINVINKRTPKEIKNTKTKSLNKERKNTMKKNQKLKLKNT